MEAEVIEVKAGIDWLTATYADEGISGELWVERCLSMLDLIAAQGYEHYERNMQGYGGVSAGNCFVGTRQGGHICQLTGYHANDHFADVYRPDLHVSRIDVQVTVKYNIMPKTIARDAYDDASTANLHLPPKRQRKLVLVTGSDGGDTIYIGAPSSEQRGRIYNKEVQSEDIQYKRTWRYEVVFRNDLATQLAEECPIEPDSRAEWAKAVVCAWFTQRGVVCGHFNGNRTVTLPLTRTMPTDVARKLAWLDKQVSPTIKWLTERGYGDTILSVLGLSRPYDAP